MRKLQIAIFVPILIFIISCKTMNRQADLIVHHAIIYSVDEELTMHEAMAIKDGLILAIGSDKNILSQYDAAETIDCQGQPLFPGFIDAHCHFYSYGLGKITKADLMGTKSFEEILEILKKHHKVHPSEWLEGRGWDQNDWEIKEFPSKDKLDELFPNTPVILTRIDGHAALVNSEAMKRAGITAETKMQGGEVKLFKGEPTGILIDNVIDSVTECIPDPDVEMQLAALQLAERNCFSVGLTSVVDAGHDIERIKVIDSLVKDNALKMRMNIWISPNKDNYDEFISQGPYKSNRLHVNGVKLYADGALGSRGACMLEPYSDDPGNSGLIMSDLDYYRNVCQKAIDHGYQVNTHAIGDSAIRMILDIYAEYLKGPNDLRWRIEHSQIVHPDDFQKYADYSIIPSIQATHATSDMYWADERVGTERIKGAYAYKQLLETNGWLPNGTDFPVEQINPMYTFYASVSRKDLQGYPKGGFQMENALSREETLKSMTIWAAKGSFEEYEKGSLEPGKYADFVILDQDIMKIREREIPSTKVVMTFVGGEMVYAAK